MATVGQSAIVSDFVSRPASAQENGQVTDRKAGPALLVGGAAYAAAYIVVGITGLSLWGTLLGIGGTAFVVLGIKLAALRAS